MQEISINENVQKIDVEIGANINQQLNRLIEFRSYLIDESYIKVSGHTHVYLLNENQINPGSIAYPRLNKNKTYIIYENNTFELFDLDTKEKIKKLVIERKK